MARKYKSRIMKHLYESAKVLYEIGGITAEELREFEVGCTVPESGGAQAGSVSTPASAYAAASGPGAGRSR